MNSFLNRCKLTRLAMFLSCLDMSLNLKSQESNFLPFQELILAYYSLLYIFSFLNSLDVTFLYKKGSFLTSISKYIQKVLQLKILSSIILVLESSDRTGCYIL